jgi:hypothetical protein
MRTAIAALLLVAAAIAAANPITVEWDNPAFYEDGSVIFGDIVIRIYQSPDLVGAVWTEVATVTNETRRTVDQPVPSGFMYYAVAVEQDAVLNPSSNEWIVTTARTSAPSNRITVRMPGRIDSPTITRILAPQ